MPCSALEPDLIVTQALCPVCAVSYEDVAKLAAKLRSKPKVLSLDPHTFGETLGDVRTVAEATGRRERGIELVAEIAGRIDRVKLGVRSAVRPRVAALEWLDPVFVAGHWTPQMIELAGGEDVLGLPGEHSIMVSWATVMAAEPEIVVVMPCGYDAPRAFVEALEHTDQLAALGARHVVAVNASAYFSRPGPRLADGVELLAHILHPELVPDAPGEMLTVQLSDTRGGGDAVGCRACWRASLTGFDELGGGCRFNFSGLRDQDRSSQRRNPDRHTADQRERLRAVAGAELDHKRRYRPAD